MMQYDKQRPNYIMDMGLSCAFQQMKINGAAERRYEHPRRADGSIDWYSYKKGEWITETQEDLETRLWEALCEILTAAEKRPVFVPVTSKEPVWWDLLAACPYGQVVAQAKSHHGNYQVLLWVFDLKGNKQ